MIRPEYGFVRPDISVRGREGRNKNLTRVIQLNSLLFDTICINLHSAKMFFRNALLLK